LDAKTLIKIWSINYLEPLLLKGRAGKILLGKRPTHRLPLWQQQQKKYQGRIHSITSRLPRRKYEQQGAATALESIYPAPTLVLMSQC